MAIVRLASRLKFNNVNDISDANGKSFVDQQLHTLDGSKAARVFKKPLYRPTWR